MNPLTGYIGRFRRRVTVPMINSEHSLGLEVDLAVKLSWSNRIRRVFKDSFDYIYIINYDNG